jgi:hypothetical protein
MLAIRGGGVSACDGITRRDLLKVGALSLFGGFTLSQPAGANRVAGRVCSVILIDLFGGPSHIDTFDPKPQAPDEIRGPFRVVSSALPGIQVTEHVPRLAGWLDRTTLIRTVSHPYNSHNPYAVMTGFTGGQDQRDYFSKPTDHPSMGSICHYAGLTRPGVPPYVVLPAYPGYSQGLRRSGPYGGYLGGQFNPLFSTCRPEFGREIDATRDFYDPSYAPIGDPELPSLGAEFALDAFDRRRTLLQQINEHAHRLDGSRAVDLLGHRQRQAFDLLANAEARHAFDLSREAAGVRDRYGRNLFGSSMLLARRLVEAGVTYITLHTESKGNGHWDTHSNNFDMLQRWLLPYLDQGVTALFDDLWQRGLWNETLVLVMGDMGRTPRINANAGRDHWPQCGFCLLAGGGIRQGHVHGRSDRSAAFPTEHPVSPGDLCATVYHLLGIDPEMTVPDLSARPNHICHGGRPISSVLA